MNETGSEKRFQNFMNEIAETSKWWQMVEQKEDARTFTAKDEETSIVFKIVQDRKTPLSKELLLFQDKREYGIIGYNLLFEVNALDIMDPITN